MYELTINENNNQFPIDGRELHSNLGSKQQFINWIKGKIEKFSFAENVDYTRNKNIKRVESFNGGGAVTEHEYFFTMKAAIKIAISTNSDAGREIGENLLIRMEKMHNTIDTAKNYISELVDLRNMIKDTNNTLQTLAVAFETLKIPQTQNNLLSAPLRAEKKPMLTVYEYFCENYPDHVLAEIDEESIATLCINRCKLFHVKLEAQRGTPVTEIKMPREYIKYVIRNNVTFYGKRLDINY